MRLVFLGTPAFAVPTLERIVEAGHQVLAVVTQPDRPRGRGQHASPPPVKEAAARLGLPVRQPERVKLPESVELLRALGAEAVAGPPPPLAGSAQPRRTAPSRLPLR